MNKAMLVAKREFVENLRTKTFWIGILSFPVIIVLAVFIGRILEESKDVRRFAVLDYSEGQWLSKAVAENAKNSDLNRMAAEVGEKLAKLSTSGGEEELSEFRETLRKHLDIRATTDLQREFVSKLVDAFRLEDFAGPKEELQGKLQKRFKGEFSQWVNRLRIQQQLEIAEMFSANLDFEKYREIENPALGEEAENALNKELNEDKIFAYFVIGEDPVTTDDDSRYVSNNVTDNDLRNWFSRHATTAVRGKRVATLNLSAAQARSIRDPFEFKEKSVTAEGETEDVGQQDRISQFAPIGFVYLLWIAVFTAAQMLLTNTVEEKSNRLIEVLLSSVSPMQLMAGKVIGIAATGLTIVVSWVISALVGVQFIPNQGELNLSAIIGDPLYLTSFVGYFLAGYLLYAAVLVAMGSVCNSLKEAQNLMQPVIILLIVPLIAMMFIVQDPNGTLARILTYIPLYTPFLMMNRASGPPPGWEYGLSTVVIILSLILAFWAAAKVFRVGILMTGKPPKIREILRWLRAPVGTVHQRADVGASQDTQA